MLYMSAWNNCARRFYSKISALLIGGGVMDKQDYTNGLWYMIIGWWYIVFFFTLSFYYEIVHTVDK